MKTKEEIQEKIDDLSYELISIRVNDPRRKKYQTAVKTLKWVLK